ncbi:Hsp20 family protein [Sinorhizobium medicae]|uniref:Hsp20 family protein n=1 Tax=Sinorhizobium medicae TaxID=110321 RepID=UPI003C792108
MRGKKQEEKEEKRRGYVLSKRSYGSFQRAFRLPDGVDANIAAKFQRAFFP